MPNVREALMRPFLTYYGGKSRAAPKYPNPMHRTIIEPFAGAAGYSVRHHSRDVILIDADENIAGTWDYLIHVSEAEILALPDLRDGQSVDDLDVPPEAKRLIGWWLNKGNTSPCKTPSAWMRQGSIPNGFWGEVIRARIASQVHLIRHWKIIHGDYTEAPDIEATWFVDPPYQNAGKYYRYGSRGFDYEALAAWCRTRTGLVIVCENEGADWLPFGRAFDSRSNQANSGRKVSRVVGWSSLPTLGGS